MTLRPCAYYGCDNYSINGVPLGHYKIFSFPKESERFERWMKLGKVDRRIPVKELFMCSDHFEPKYISVTPVRTQLLKTSVPIAYEDVCVQETEDGLETSSLDDVVLEYADTTELDDSVNDTNPKGNAKTNDTHFVLSSDNESFSLARVDESKNESCYQHEFLTIETNPEPSPKKRLLNNNQTTPCENSIKVRTNPIKRKRNMHTFIHKGEEYIQMPKADYLNEKTKLLNQIKKYKALFGDLSKQLKEFEQI